MVFPDANFPARVHSRFLLCVLLILSIVFAVEFSKRLLSLAMPPQMIGDLVGLLIVVHLIFADGCIRCTGSKGSRCCFHSPWRSESRQRQLKQRHEKQEGWRLIVTLVV